MFDLMEENLLNTKQVAQILGCGYTKASELMHSKTSPP